MLDGRGHELGAVAKVDVEGAAREARARADRVEARLVEAFFGELGDAGQDQGFARLAFADRAGSGGLSHLA